MKHLPNLSEPSSESVELSRSAKKRAAKDLQKLGISLTHLAPEILEELELPPKLLEALNQLPKLSTREAKRRQMQYIGRLMRDVPKPTIAAIERLQA